MTTVAGKAIVPFEGDYSSLIMGGAKAAEKVGGSLKSIVAPAALVAGAVSGIGLATLDMAVKYNKSTAQFAANSNETIKQAQQVGRAFLATGGQTEFSAQQMMDAITPVNGVLEMLNGGLLTTTQEVTFMRAAMNLAEATGSDLSSTTSTLVGVMQAYHLTVGDAAMVTDILRNTSKASNLSLADLATTVERLHSKLGPLSPSLADTSTLLVDMAEHGITGSRAMTAVSTGLTTLLGSSKDTAKEVKNLKLELFGSNGQFVGMSSIIAQLQPKLETMTEKQRLQAEAALFGAGAGRTLDATLLAGLPAWAAAQKAVEKHGTAAASAQTATSSLGGELDRLKTKVEDEATSFGETLVPAATKFTNWLIDDGVPDLISFGGWLDKNLINPFISIATVVIPPLLTALGWVGGHIQALGIIAAPVIAGIAGMWAVDKIKGWVSAAESGIKNVVAFWLGQSGGGVASSALGAAGVQQVYVTNWAMMGGASSGEAYLADDAIGGGLAAGGGEEAAGLLASILTPEVMVPIAAGLLATLGIAYVATHPAGATVTKGPTDLASAVASNPGLLLGQNPQGFAEPGDSLNQNMPHGLASGEANSIASHDRKSQELSDDAFQALQFKYTAIAQAQGYTLAQWVLIQQSSKALATLAGEGGEKASVDLTLLENQWRQSGVSAQKAAGVVDFMQGFIDKHGPLTTSELGAFQDIIAQTNLSWASTRQATNSIEAWMAKNGPLTVAQLQAFKDDLAGGVTSAFDVALSMKSINIALAPAVDYASRYAAAISSGLTPAQAAKVAKPGHSLDSGGQITEDVVGYGQESGDLWKFHKNETVTPNSRIRSGKVAGGGGFMQHNEFHLYGQPDSLVAQIQTIVDRNLDDVREAAAVHRS